MPDHFEHCSVHFLQRFLLTWPHTTIQIRRLLCHRSTYSHPQISVMFPEAVVWSTKILSSVLWLLSLEHPSCLNSCFSLSLPNSHIWKLKANPLVNYSPYWLVSRWVMISNPRSLPRLPAHLSHQFQASATAAALSVQTSALPNSLWNRAGCHHHPLGKKSSPSPASLYIPSCCSHSITIHMSSPWAPPLCAKVPGSPHTSPTWGLCSWLSWGRQLG